MRSRAALVVVNEEGVTRASSQSVVTVCTVTGAWLQRKKAWMQGG